MVFNVLVTGKDQSKGLSGVKQKHVNGLYETFNVLVTGNANKTKVDEKKKWTKGHLITKGRIME